MRKAHWLNAAVANALAATVLAGAAHAAVCGDVNNDGAVTAADGGVLENRLLNPATPICGGTGIACADLNANGTVDTGDRTILGQVIAGVETLYAPCTGPAAPTCPSTWTGDITTNQHWGPAPCEVKLDGPVLVTNNAVLTVDPGVVVKGIKNPSNPAALIVLRGSKLDANGTAGNPIVFTSDQPPGSRSLGDWGGVTLNGFAPVNFPGGVGSSEGLPPGLALYGGNDPADNVGRVRFARIEYSGIELSTDNELNVFTMNALGTGTVIDHVQAHRGNDDCHEWFGGTVRTKYLVATGCRDDGLDWQIGFRGTVQFAVVHQAAAGVDGSGRHGFEADNNEFGFNNLPRSNPQICNVTAIGARPQGITIGGSGAQLRRGTAGTIANSIFASWRSSCLNIADNDTIGRGCLNATTLRTGADVLRVQDSICFNNGTGGTTVMSGGATSPCTPAELGALWTTSTGLNTTTDPSIPWATAASFPGNPLNTSNYVPGIALSGPDCKNVNPTVFDSAPFIGALPSVGSNWLNDASVCGPGQIAGCWLNVELN